MVIWLIGISGAGKTTLGCKLKEVLEKQSKLCYLIDGDLIRSFFENDLGFSEGDRKHNIKRIILAGYVLEQNGIIPVICNISPYEELRQFARRKMDDYNEIFLKKSVASSQEADVKKIYRENKGKTQLVGIDTPFERPENSDLTLDTDMEGVDESFEKISFFLAKKYGKEFS